MDECVVGSASLGRDQVFGFQDCGIGYFGDKRRQRAGRDLFESLVTHGTLVVKGFSSNRAELVRFERFLWNKAVDVEEILKGAFEQTAENADMYMCPHVLCFQDSTEVDLGKRPNDIRTESMGLLKNRDVSGFYLHPVLAVDARDDFVLGLASASQFEYERPRKKKIQWEETKKPVEEKNSYRWIDCAKQASETLSRSKLVTIISDRESDFYEYLSRVPKGNFHIIVRAKGDRLVSSTPEDLLREKLKVALDRLPAMGQVEIEVSPRAKVSEKRGAKAARPARTKRLAILEVRYSTFVLHRSKTGSICDPKSTTLYVVDVREDRSTLDAETEPIHWMLITSHPVTSLDEALQIVNWYKKRWHIEQLFRAAKKGGMRIEEIELSRGDSIKKLTTLGLLASVAIMQLTLCRDGVIDRPATLVFSETEIQVLGALQPKLEGSTKNLRNPHNKGTVAWSHWIVGRLGGWMGYSKYGGPAGPISMKRGLDELNALVRGWQLRKDVCIT